MNGSHSASPPCGKKLNLSASIAACTTTPAPPAMSASSQATASSPTRITTVWNRSVIATDHMPPQIV